MMKVELTQDSFVTINRHWTLDIDWCKPTVFRSWFGQFSASLLAVRLDREARGDTGDQPPHTTEVVGEESRWTGMGPSYLRTRARASEVAAGLSIVGATQELFSWRWNSGIVKSVHHLKYIRKAQKKQSWKYAETLGYVVFTRFYFIFYSFTSLG